MFTNDTRMRLQIFILALAAYGVRGIIVTEPEGSVPLIIGGGAATAGEFQGKISIQFMNGTHNCGGTLIDPSHVLTTASCVTNEWGDVVHPSAYRLMGDDLSISVQSGNANRQIRFPSHIFVHPEFHLNTGDHNLAIIRVNVTFTPSATFNPVARGQDPPALNVQCTIAGWGATSSNSGNSFTLNRANTAVISRAVCNSDTFFGGTVRGGMFCAGNQGVGNGPCQGDEGGGLICANLIFGVITTALNCFQPNFPTIYTDVSVYNPWIDSSINWSGGEHEIVPTPTSMTSTTTTTTTTTEAPGGAGFIVNSMYLFVVCMSILFLR